MVSTIFQLIWDAFGKQVHRYVFDIMILGNVTLSR